MVLLVVVSTTTTNGNFIQLDNVLSLTRDVTFVSQALVE
jgi:hypothetical protein